MSELIEPVEPGKLASSGLLSFYDRLRNRVTDFAQRRAGKSGRGIVELLLLAPDLFILLLRLILDNRVPAGARRLILGALVYFVTPIDLLPEALLGPAGLLEDVVLAAAVLSVALGPDLEAIADGYWNGSQRLRVVLRDVSDVAYNVLGHNLYVRLQRLLSRRGIHLE